MVISPTRYLWLLPLTLIPQRFMEGPAPFGADTSGGIIPMPHILLYYAIFFGFGALYYDCDPVDRKVGRFWWLTIPVGLLIYGLGMSLMLNRVGRGLAPGPAHFLSMILSVSYAWLMTFAFIGMFRAMISREIKWVRYLSDSSYWLYLAHLPLILVLQWIVRDWAMSPILKFLMICLVTTALLLLSYEFLIRYGWVGKMLNAHEYAGSKCLLKRKKITLALNMGTRVNDH